MAEDIIAGRNSVTEALRSERSINKILVQDGAKGGSIGEIIAAAKSLTLDLKGLEYISSAGLRVLLNAHKKMQLIGSMKLINVCEEVMELFEMTGFANILVIE